MTDETRLRADIETRIQTLRYAEAHRFAKAERERCTDDILRDVDALIAASRARVRELETALRELAEACDTEKNRVPLNQPRAATTLMALRERIAVALANAPAALLVREEGRAPDRREENENG